MSTQPLVSVVIPTYNRARYIRECIESVQNQTHSHLEILVIDDGSTDHTSEIMEAMVNSDLRIQYITQDNAGVSAARNHGMKLATGDFVALLDSDDAWHPWKLQLQLAALQAAPESGMVWTDMSTIDESSRLLSERHLQKMYGAYQSILRETLFTKKTTLDCSKIAGCPVGKIDVESGNIYSSIIHGNLVHTSTVLLTRERVEQVKGFDERLRPAGEDYAFHLTTCRYGDVAFLDIPSTFYRIGLNDQITHKRNQVHFAKAFLSSITQEISDHRDKIDLSDRELKEILTEARLWIGRELAEEHFSLEALSQISHAIIDNPLRLNAWYQLARAATPARFRKVARSLKKGTRKKTGALEIIQAG